MTLDRAEEATPSRIVIETYHWWCRSTFVVIRTKGCELPMDKNNPRPAGLAGVRICTGHDLQCFTHVACCELGDCFCQLLAITLGSRDFLGMDLLASDDPPCRGPICCDERRAKIVIFA
jgi:hypothetical protein